MMIISSINTSDSARKDVSVTTTTTNGTTKRILVNPEYQVVSTSSSDGGNENNKASVSNLARRRSSQVTKTLRKSHSLQLETIELEEQQQQNNDPSNNDINNLKSSISLADYLIVMQNYPMYRAYFLSHFCMNMGDWFVRIASLLVVEELDPNSGSVMANLVLSNLLPRVLFSQLGGILSDTFDRRKLMVTIDFLSAVVVLGYLLAVHFHSIDLLFLITFFRSSLTALYYPVTTGIVPMLIPEPRDLQLAVTLNSWAWGSTSIFGGILAGSISARVGLSTCYIIDSVTFILSAIVIYFGVHGQFKATSSNQENEDRIIGMNSKNPLTRIASNIFQVSQYLYSCGFGLLVLQKASGSMVWGVEDIVGVEFTTVFDPDTGEEDEEASGWNMGLLFASIGVGCSIGPMILNFCTDGNKPRTLQRACVIGLTVLSSAWLLISAAQDVDTFLFLTLIRTMGSGIIWVNSTLTLQTLCSPEILGRVLAVEYMLSTLTEAMTAAIAGHLQDAGFGRNELALFGGILGYILVIIWAFYYYQGCLDQHDAFTRLSNTTSDIAEDKAEVKFSSSEKL